VPFVPSHYTAGVAIAGAGNGGSRDGGAGPAFTGFPMKMVTAAGAVAIGAVVEAGFVNRANRALVANESVFGSDIAALAAPA
jgi:glyoxylate carboligase